MDPAFYSDIKNSCGIDLSNYYIDKNSYNSIVYIHKKYLPKEAVKQTNLGPKLIHQNTNDKSQQFDYDRINCETYKTKIIESDYKDPILEQTIKFAKDLIPITIPPSTNLTNPVYYTIKSCKKTKRKHEPNDNNIEHAKDVTFDKEKSKHTIETVKQEKLKRNRNSLSTASATHSSLNNTIDDINENQSLSYSLSEVSERKHLKKDLVPRNKNNNSQKIIASESFEAIAAEYMNIPSDSKIKIHLMHEKDKQLMYENIRTPVLKAIKECFLELNNQIAVNTEMKNVNRAIRSHASKLDNILDKLTCIENKLELLTKTKSSRTEIIKASKLEEVGQDFMDVKEDFSSEEELACVNFSNKTRSKNTPVTPIFSENDAERDSVDNLARGENIPEHIKFSLKPEHTKKIPARFCWTDTGMKN